jgi:quinoprotein glucose dehydrogenase
VAAAIGIGLHALPPVRFDPIYQRGIAQLSGAQTAIPLGEATASGEWTHFGSDLGGSRFSSMDQITPANVSRLKVAWTYRTGPSPQGDKATLEERR